jgi:myo-inositol-1(or 4)-monophosphatase
MSLDLNYALSIAIKAAKRAGKILKNFQKQSLKCKRKMGYDIVTNADLMAQQEIINYMKRYFPDHEFISEELEVEEKEMHRFRWIIDPLDGTINYAAGLPLFSVSIALQRQTDTILGVIYDPSRNNLYTAIKGQGSFSNGKSIHVSDNSDLGNSVLTFMLTSHYTEEEVETVLKHVRILSSRCRGLRLFVSQALELAYLASGIIDGVICIKSRGFSSAAGILLTREAGGKVTDLRGEEFNSNSRSLLATNAKLHDQIFNLLQSSHGLGDKNEDKCE